MRRWGLNASLACMIRGSTNITWNRRACPQTSSALAQFQYPGRHQYRALSALPDPRLAASAAAHRAGSDNLQKIGNLLGDFDLVALQEADGGSLRSGYVNQVEHLAQLGAFPYWYQQLNRNLGRLGQHSNGVLSRLRPWAIEDHPLPGPKGRGAILVRFGEGPEALVVVMMHLALGARTRSLQLAYIRELIGGYKHQVLMGDMNTHASDLLQNSPLRDLGLLAPQLEATFPSWRPQRCLDHILLSPTLTLEKVEVLAQPISDHLPVAVEIRLPGSLTADALPALSPALRGTPE
jgi:endonuclease/exonuclease/phosphatase family metal-dependent hydrolase